MFGGRLVIRKQGLILKEWITWIVLLVMFITTYFSTLPYALILYVIICDLWVVEDSVYCCYGATRLNSWFSDVTRLAEQCSLQGRAA
jgi:hypothetical protein